MNFVQRQGISYLFLCVAMLTASISISAQDPTATPTPITQFPSTVQLPDPLELPDDPPPVSPDFAAPMRPLPSSERIGVDNADQLALTLADAIEMALENNNDIEISRDDQKIAAFGVRRARGAYDPLLATQSFFERATTPVASTIGGAADGFLVQNRYFGSAGINGLVPWQGGSYTSLMSLSRSNTSNTNATLNPQYPSSLALQYIQPIFRGRRFDITRHGIEIARKNVEVSDIQFRQQTINVVTMVEQAYWDLTFALRNLQVTIDAVKQARTQLESNQRLVSKGVLPPIDLVAATAQISTLEQSVYAAQESVTRAENTLKTMLLPERKDERWNRPLTPVSPIEQEPPQLALELATDEAIRNRPEVKLLDSATDINKLDERLFRDQTKPRIDLVGQYTTQGLAGTQARPTAPINLVGGPGTSLGQLFGQEFPTYRVGVEIGLPFGNNVAKANLGQTLVEGQRIEKQRAQTEQIIEAEVRNALQALRSSESRLSSALAARIAAEQIYESEQRLFRAGTTTFFMVLQRQNELLAARAAELQAQTDLNKAISEFQRAIGRTLETNNITLK